MALMDTNGQHMTAASVASLGDFPTTEKCPHEECVAYGACGHHGSGGACLVQLRTATEKTK